MSKTAQSLSLCLGAAAWLCACGAPDAGNGPAGGPVMGAMDTHCTAPQATSQASCTGTGGPTDPDYGDTLYNSSGFDDDCKYKVVFTVPPVRKSDKTTFTINVTSNTTSQPVTGADIRIEAFLSDIHPAPNTGAQTKEQPSGTYTVNPIVFDASGRWTVRFHLFESCTDALPDSPHGHAAFFIDVP